MLRNSFLTCFSLLIIQTAFGQKAFVEGVVTYKVIITQPQEDAHAAKYEGTYKFTFKGKQIKKELKLNNGYEDVILIDLVNNTSYSLQHRNGKKYAIQLDINKYADDQAPFEKFSLKDMQNDIDEIAGYHTTESEITYKDGNTDTLYYTNEWYPAEHITFERFPGIKVFPLAFNYTTSDNTVLSFKAEKLEAIPIDNSVFRLPRDYKIVSKSEYKQE